MSTTPCACLPPVLCLALALPLAAQDTGSYELPEGHSGHGEVFNEGPRQAAYLMDNPDSVHFPVTVAEGDGQAFFDQGVGQLHGFWYFEAERSFRQVAALDRDCAMAYWGMAMANVDNPERAAGFARVAWLKRGLVSDRERRYIDAIARYHGVDGPEEPADDEAASEEGEGEDGPPDRERAREERERRREQEKERAARLVKDYEEIVWEYPDDIEAKAFLVNRLWLNRGVLPITSRQANEALLQQIFAVQPMHPAHHYRIHLWDLEDQAARVVESAVRSGPSWPSVAHQWHMGGHIFARLGRHADAAWQQEASARVDHAQMMRDRVLPDQIHNFAHNNEWLTRSLRHAGRVRESVDLARNMIELPRHPLYNTPEKRGTSSWYGRQRLLETLELFEQWDELVALADTMYLEPSEDVDTRALRAYVLGKAHAYRGDEQGFAAQLEALRALVEERRAERAADLVAAEDEVLEEDPTPPGAELREALDGVLERHARPLADLRERVEALEALDAALAGDDLEANLELLRERRFALPHLARLYSQAELHEKAVETAREATERPKNDAYAHATLAQVLLAAGRTDEALEAFDTLREWSARFDLDLPVFQRLAPLAELRGLPADWRVPDVVPDDVLERPELASLGPWRWSPPPAAPWTLPDGLGHERSLADYRGRPVIVIFYLGFGCVHCVEQLQAFGPATERFREAGIDLVAIGTDTEEALADAAPEDGEEPAYPFPLLADPGLDVFELYRAHDDFERMPLHGTFLVDGRGRVRWQDISYEPFMDWKFLLDESQRLLGLPDPAVLEAAAPVSASSTPSLPTGGG